MPDTVKRSLMDDLKFSLARDVLVVVSPCSETKDKTAVLHGTVWFLNVPHHITFVRVTQDEDGYDAAVDECYEAELEHLYALAEPGGGFAKVHLPDLEGEYLLYLYPYSE